MVNNFIYSQKLDCFFFSDKLLMGLENKVELIIENSASSLEQGSKLEIITSPEVEVQATDAGRILSVDEISEEENLKFNFSLLHDIVDGDSIEMEVSGVSCEMKSNGFVIYFRNNEMKCLFIGHSC